MTETLSYDARVDHETVFTTPFERFDYGCYQDLGGIINQDDVNSALERAEELFAELDQLNFQAFRAYKSQAESIASFANFPQSFMGAIIALYVVLRTDVNPGQEYHHDTMSDQRIMAAVVRILNLPEHLDRLKRAYPNINFD